MLRNAFRGSVFVCALVLAIAAAGLAVTAGAASAAPTTCSGVVFQDYDADGERTEDYSFVSNDFSAVLDDGVPGIAVAITTTNGTVLNTTTGGDGSWSLGLDTEDFPVRIDFSGLPNEWSSTPKGPDAAGLTQFVETSSECGINGIGNAGIIAPGTFCENRPEIVTSCFLFGDVANHDDQVAIASFVDGAVDNGAADGSDWTDDDYVIEATLGQVGTVFGIETLENGTTLGAAFVKRHTQLGPTDNPTTIYAVEASGNVGPWYTVDNSATDPHSGEDDGWLNDFDAFSAVGREGLGDIEVSPDGSTVYTVDLGRKLLVAIPVNADGSANASGVTTTPITQASTGARCSDQDLRPFGLGFDGPTLLVGVTCSGESSVNAADYPTDVINGPALGDASQLSAHVYAFNGGFSLVTNVPLPTTSRGSQNTGTGDNAYRGQSDWRPWLTQPPFVGDFTGYPAGGVAYAQPLLSDIEIDGDDLVIGFMDLWGHQMGSNAFYQGADGNVYQLDQPLSSGDAVRAFSDGSGGYTYPTSGPDFFYTGDSYLSSHSETALGASAQIPGRPYVINNAFDPIELPGTWQSGGVEYYDNATGESIQGYRLYNGRNGLATGTFEKAAGIGDVEAVCGVADIQVGDRVWFDADQDGIADPEERALAGVVIELVNAAGATIATTTTDEDGLYSFNTADIDGFNHGATYDIVVSQDNYDVGGVFNGGVHDGLGFPTFANAGSDDFNDSDGVLVNGVPTVTFTATATDHSMDFGFVPESYRLGNTVFLDLDEDGSQGNGEPGIAGVEVQLQDAAGNVVATETTDSNGNYLFEGLDAGDYVVAIAETQLLDGAALDGLESTDGNGTAPDPDDDVDLDDNGDPAPGYASVSAPVTLGNGEPLGEAGEDAVFPDGNSNLTVDFGFVPSYRLGDTVWFDPNNNGVQDAGEPGIAGVDVQLLNAADNSVVATTTTDSSGEYIFEDLDAGEYVVAISSVNQPALDGLSSSDGNGTAPDPDDDVDLDDNGDPAAGFASISAPVTIGGTEPAGEVTEDGTWVDSLSNLTVDFGFTGDLRLGSTVWLDSNGDGDQDGNEPGIAGVEVQLWSVDAAGNPDQLIGTTTTDNDGNYVFENLAADDYIVAIPESNQDAGAPLEGIGSTSGNGVAPDPDDDTDLDDNGDSAAGFASISAPVTLSAGDEPTGEAVEGGWVDADSNLTVDFGFVEGLRLGNLVFEDLNNDGVANPGEPGIEGVEVQLLDTAGNVIATDTTDANGNYIFEGLLPGNYVVAVADSEQDSGNALDGLESTDGNGVAPDPDDDVDLDDNGDPEAGFASISDPVTLTSNVEPTGEAEENGPIADDDSNLTVDLGFVRNYRLGNTVFIDTNIDGVQNAGEPGVAGVEVQLWSTNAAGAPDAIIDTTTTNAQGKYLFEDLAAGDYVVAIADTQQAGGQALAGLASTDGNGAAPDPDDDVDLDDNGDPAPGFASISAPVTLGGTEPAGEVDEDGSWSDVSSNLTVDFGFVGSLRLGSTVWLDSNGDGFQDPTEPGIAGVVVQLLDEDGSLIATTVTDADGNYVFENLPEGKFIVAIPDTQQADGEALQGLGSTAGNGVAPDPDDDVDLDDNGDAANGFASISQPVMLTAGGEPAGEALEDGSVADTDSNLTVDFGFLPGLELGNTVFFDDNNDGEQGPTEGVAEGVTIQLLDAAGNVVATDVTDADGFYLFTGIAPGTYTVHIPASEFGPGAPLEGFHGSTGAGVSSDPNDDVDGNSDGIVTGPAAANGLSSGPVTLTAGNEPAGEADVSPTGTPDTDSNLTVDFGVYTLSIGNLVFFDDNNNGAQDPGEDPIAGVVLALLDGNGNPVPGPDGEPLTVTTDANGNYSFDGLAEGTYIVEVLAENFAPGGPLEGVTSSNGNDVNGAAPDPDDDNDGDDNGNFVNGVVLTDPIVLAAAEEPDGNINFTVDFGFIEDAGLGSFVFFDENNNGVQDPGEPGVPDVIVTVRDAATGEVVATTTTDANGEYSVTGLVPGSYTVSFDDPEDRGFTSQNVGDDALDSDASADGSTGIVTLEGGEFNPTIDAGIVTSSTATSGPPLAFTGANSLTLALWAAILAMFGFVLVAVTGRKDEDEVRV